MDISLYYEKRGAGEPLVLLHGNGEDGSYFLHQMEAFSREFLVYALDTRGHGRSPRGSAPFTISQFAEDLLAFLDEQGLKRVNLLGFSDGGNIALTFALRHPERDAPAGAERSQPDPSWREGLGAAAHCPGLPDRLAAEKPQGPGPTRRCWDSWSMSRRFPHRSWRG